MLVSLLESSWAEFLKLSKTGFYTPPPLKAVLHTVGALLLTVQLLSLQSVEVLIGLTFPLQGKELQL